MCYAVVRTYAESRFSREFQIRSSRKCRNLTRGASEYIRISQFPYQHDCTLFQKFLNIRNSFLDCKKATSFLFLLLFVIRCTIKLQDYSLRNSIHVREICKLAKMTWLHWQVTSLTQFYKVRANKRLHAHRSELVFFFFWNRCQEL